MLFTYKYITHEVNKLQGYLDYLFSEVWIYAEGDFDFKKLCGNLELQQLYIDFGNDDGKWAKFFNESIENIYKEFAKLDDDAKLDLIDYYYANNSIESLCKDKSIIPITYSELSAKYSELKEVIKKFYSKLYGSESPFNLKVFGFLNDKLIPSHYEEFMKINDEEVCPFCGINRIKGNNNSCREAYDHYLPKGNYPFSAVNFENLAPMCHECNSSYKFTKDPIYKSYDGDKESHRQLAFYPYSLNHPDIDFKIELNTIDIKNLKPDNIIITIEAVGYDEEIESWKRVFCIVERYKALCCSKNEGIAWFTSVVDDYDNVKALAGDIDCDKWFDMYITSVSSNLLHNYGFLKLRFLEECKRKGLFKFKVEKVIEVEEAHDEIEELQLVKVE